MSSQQPKIRVIISGGGTGGHIFPAVSIAQTLMKMNPDNEILFVGANGRMEMEKVPAAGFRIVGLNIAGLQRRLTFSNFLLPFRILDSLRKARQIIRDFKPDVAVGVGGYASGPLLFMASRSGVPCLIQEQNSFAGITNRLLAGSASSICVAYEGMQRYFPKDKIHLTGNPIRTGLSSSTGNRTEAFAHFGLSSHRPVVLVIGGSLGARTINQSIAGGLAYFIEQGVQVIWQTGKSGHASAIEAVNRCGSDSIKVHDFISRMDLAYAAADVVVSRAGASSVSELAVVGKPCILVPSPNVAEDHQTKNARSLVDRNAALMVKDVEAGSILVSNTLELVADLAKREELSKNISALALPEAANVIANEVYRLALGNG